MKQCHPRSILTVAKVLGSACVLSWQVLFDDMKDLGYHFTWKVVDSQKYALPQRRNRVWGVACLATGEESLKHIGNMFSECLESMKSNFQFPERKNFPPKPQCDPQDGRHAQLVEKAKEASFRLENLFVDTHGSLKRSVYAAGAVPCLTPDHSVYAVGLKRYLDAEDMLNCQGLWRSTWSASGYKQLMRDPAFAQSLAGNSFSSTVCQCILLTSFVCSPSSWQHVKGHQGSGAQEGPVLQRLKGKQTCKAYDSAPKASKKKPQAEKSKPRQRRRCRFKRKNAGIDSRKLAKGKKAMATIWQKEKVFCT